MVDIRKALTTTTGDAIIPEEIDKIITDIAIKETPVLSLFKEIPWDTNSFEWNERTALVTAAAYSESSTFSETNSTYSRATVSIKMVKTDGAVTNLLQLTSKSYINALQTEIESASANIGQEIERLYIQGNVGLTSAEFNGLSNLVSQTSDAAGASISLDILDDGIDAVILGTGKPGLILVANRDLFELGTIMRENMSYYWEKMEVAAGNKLTTYRGIPIVGSHFVPTTEGGSGWNSYAFVLDLSQIVVPVVLPLKYEDMTAKVTSDSIAFRIKTYRALAVKAGGYRHCRITNIGRPV